MSQLNARINHSRPFNKLEDKNAHLASAASDSLRNNMSTVHPSPASCFDDVANLEWKYDGLVEYSLGIFSIKSPIRKQVIDLVMPPSHFDRCILVTIFLNSLAIASLDYNVIDENYQPSTNLSMRNKIIENTEIMFTVIFASESILKSVAFGLISGKRAYIRDGWNALDFFIVVVR